MAARQKKTPKRKATKPEPRAATRTRKSVKGHEPLEGLRDAIDRVDQQLHQLLNERARLARQVGISKTQSGRLVDFYRPEREAQVLRMALARNAEARGQGGLRDEEIVRLFREIMSACLAQEEFAAALFEVSISRTVCSGHRYTS